MTRRSFLPAVAGAAALASSSAAQPVERKGRIKQGVTGGVFGKGMSFEDQCRNAANLGAKGFDLKGPNDFAMIKKYGLVPSMVPSTSGIKDGINRKENHARIDKGMRESIAAAAEAGAPNVIVLSGSKAGMSDEEGISNCVAFFDNIKKYAEDKNVTLCLELLNSKVNHPDYHCDHTKWGVEVCKRVNSPRVKLLFDIYHMQIMEGDIIRTIRENYKYIGHYHTAGNPGRHEFDDTQEMNYHGIALALAELKYEGFLSHEYGPLHDPLKSLDEALRICDV